MKTIKIYSQQHITDFVMDMSLDSSGTYIR